MRFPCLQLERKSNLKRVPCWVSIQFLYCILMDVKSVSKHCHFQGGYRCKQSLSPCILPLKSGCIFGFMGTMSLAAMVPWTAVFALRCLHTVTIELAMFYCQSYILCGYCFALDVFKPIIACWLLYTIFGLCWLASFQDFSSQGNFCLIVLLVLGICLKVHESNISSLSR